jgi:hypothetical protein
MKHTFAVIVTLLLTAREPHRPPLQPVAHDAAACGRQDRQVPRQPRAGGGGCWFLVPSSGWFGDRWDLSAAVVGLYHVATLINAI